jgi:hypothetical protein
VNCQTAIVLHSGSFAGFLVRLAAVLVDCCRWNQRALRYCATEIWLLCDAFPMAGDYCLPRRRSVLSKKATRPNVIESPHGVGNACALEATRSIQTTNRNANTRTMHFDSGEPAWFPHY